MTPRTGGERTSGVVVTGAKSGICRAVALGARRNLRKLNLITGQSIAINGGMLAFG